MAIQVWVARASSMWKTITEGARSMDNPHLTQKDAIADGKERAQELKCELVIQNKHGQIRQKDSYGNDPKSIKG
jgi:hypothetical protein